MDIAERIAQKEYRRNVHCDHIELLEFVGANKKYIQKEYDKLKQLEESIKHDKEIQKKKLLGL